MFALCSVLLFTHYRIQLNQVHKERVYSRGQQTFHSCITKCSALKRFKWYEKQTKRQILIMYVQKEDIMNVIWAQLSHAHDKHKHKFHYALLFQWINVQVWFSVISSCILQKIKQEAFYLDHHVSTHCVDYVTCLCACSRTKKTCLYTFRIRKTCTCVTFNTWHPVCHIITHRCTWNEIQPHDF